MLKDLCEELIVEIFSWLPPKSVLRFRSVSKSLRARIGSPGFIRLHTLRSSKKLTMIIHLVQGKGMYTMHSEGQLSSYAGTTPVEYPFGRIYTISGSCNGTLCVYEYERSAFHLWNPSIRRTTTVHEPPSWGRSHVHGIGFDQLINDYKIVRTSKGGTFVYTMKTRAWREIASPATPIFSVKGSPCLFDGALHWVVGGYLFRDYVMTFDLSSEVFSAIELPEPTWYNTQVTVVKGCLAVVSLQHHDRRRCIWVRDTSSASWSVGFQLHKDELVTDGGLLVTHDSKEILVYNPATLVRSRLEHLVHSHCIAAMNTFVETIELLDVYDQTITGEGKRKREREAQETVKSRSFLSQVNQYLMP